jgi:UDPglucose 6-dehydrogenase
MSETIVGFAGMTHLGLVSASAVAARGFRTICFDADAHLIERLRAGILPVLEATLDHLIRGNGDRQQFTSRIDDLARCQVVYIAPDVPTDDAGHSDTRELSSLIAATAAVLNASAALVVLSQVEPGFTRALVAPPCPRRYYQVETLVFGRAVERAIRPERYILGCATPQGALHAGLREVLTAFDCPILPMSYESAELAKIAINMCLVASVTVSNTLAELCERIGADWAEIIPALQQDQRIGPKAYLAPGLGIAGGNLERDLATVCRLADAAGADARLVHAMLGNSRYRRDWPLRILYQQVLEKTLDPVITVLGLAYKENTRSIKNSPAVTLIRRLKGSKLRAFDPEVTPDAAWHDSLEPAKDMISACDGADALIIMTPWPAFRELDPALLARRMRGNVIIDPYRILKTVDVVAAGLKHFVLGAPCTP